MHALFDRYVALIIQTQTQIKDTGSHDDYSRDNGSFFDIIVERMFPFFEDFVSRTVQ